MEKDKLYDSPGPTFNIIIIIIIIIKAIFYKSGEPRTKVKFTHCWCVSDRKPETRNTSRESRVRNRVPWRAWWHLWLPELTLE